MTIAQSCLILSSLMKTPVALILLTGAFAASTASASLVAHWPLDSNSNDVIGGHNGDAPGAVTYSDEGGNANTGGSAVFDGTDGIQVPYSADLNPDNFTVSAWVKPSTGASWNSVVTSREDNGTSVNGYILYNSPDGNWDFWTGGGGGPGAWERTIDPNAFSQGTWSHLAITYDASTTTKVLYVNGVAVSTEVQSYVPNGTTPETSRPFNIGAGQDFGDGFFFTGNIDDVAVWDEALSADAIGSVMLNGVGVIPEPSSVLLFAFGSAATFLRRRR